MATWTCVFALVALAAPGLVGAGAALAQSGGSIGGGSFGGGGGGGSFGGGGGSFGGGSFGGSSSSFGGSSGGGRPMTREDAKVLIGVIGSVLLVILAVNLGPKLYHWWMDRTRLRVRLTRVRFGVAAPYGDLLETLMRLASSADVSNPAGLARLVREAALALRRDADAIRYVSVHEAGTRPLSKAEGPFQALASEERSRFTREVVRRDPTGLRRGRAARLPGDGLHDENGDFGVAEYMVVTLVLAHRELIGAHADVASVEAMRELLRDLGDAATQETVAVELIWSPAADTDILAEREMIVAYGDLVPLG
ncbi:MAG: DUF1517 domain-containing protein [Deltaproteobacteria bacterium]|nr:DUF1517 domain-containing protein [Deltaproteobacteria bacterium]